MSEKTLIFLKLGGSLITDKNKALTPRLWVMTRIAAEIAETLQVQPDIQLLIGHGSGSFGHAVASQYNTQKGGDTHSYWQGFAKVWKAARDLNQILIRCLSEAGLPVLAFPPSAGVTASNARFLHWNVEPIRQALSHNLIPVVQGDVVLDQALGGTIFSTEQVFSYLSEALRPKKIFLAGQDPGVYRDPAQKQDVIPEITLANIKTILPSLAGSEAVDVTGGMAGKICWMLSLVESQPELHVQVFSGAETGQIKKALMGEVLGTTIINRSIH
jgi:isopentenyl phosphate kinase